MLVVEAKNNGGMGMGLESACSHRCSRKAPLDQCFHVDLPFKYLY